MQAIILAAGMGRRLKELTKNNTKCMVKVNGVTLIERMLHQIERRDICRVIIVIGYEGEKLVEYIQGLDITLPIHYVVNTLYDKTNNIYSLALAQEYLKQDDTLLFESDLIFEDAVLDKLLDDPSDTLALVDKYEGWMDGTCVKLASDDTIEMFVSRKNFKFREMRDYFKTVNIYKFSKHFSETYYVPFLNAYEKALGENEYYEQVLRVITMLDKPVIKAKRLTGEKWYEIDDIQDLDIAESIFMPDEEQRISLLQGRFGGYWRYPKLIDFCYLVNPFFPPERLMDELEVNFRTLLVSYPSGMRVNSLLAAKNFNIAQENILVGNGAAELIKAMMSRLKGKIGIIRPTFEEYAQRYPESDIVCFWPNNKNYAYTAADVIEFFDRNPINNLILINPDNPSGNYIPRSGLLELISWTKERGILLIIDESFSDFVDESESTLLENQLLLENPHLYVIKSISKSYGVPGLRLGVLASGSKEAVSEMKRDVAIWNINSFGEFYLQIMEKYKEDYVRGLEKFRKERKRYQSRLQDIPGLRVIPSQANFIMAEIVEGLAAAELTRILIEKYNILIKNLSDKMDRENCQYIRLAIKSPDENDILVEALNKIMGDQR